MSDRDTTSQAASRHTDQQEHTLDDLFSLLQSLRGEVAEFGDSLCLFKTPPLSEMLESAGTVADQKDELGREFAEISIEIAEIAKVVTGMRNETTEIANGVTEVRNAATEIAKVSRRIESKVNGISIDVAELKGTLYDHEVRLEALESR